MHNSMCQPGSTDTSLWTHYQRGERLYCGVTFPDGISKNDRLPCNVITPTTKSETHDELITPLEILEHGLMSHSQWEAASRAALALFEFGQAVAAEQGLILVDTKYEFGVDRNDTVVLIDEVCSGAIFRATLVIFGHSVIFMTILQI